jgi:alpha-amylase
MSKSIQLYLHVHQPWRVREYSAFDTGVNHNYFEENSPHSGTNNARIFRKVADKSYFPTNAALLDMLNQHSEFKFSLSMTGTFIEQCERYMPELLESFKALVDTGRVEIVGETYYHSLAFFYNRAEFDRQVAMHAKKIHEIFGVRPKAFRNTELAYDDDLGRWAEAHGYKTVLAEGWDKVLAWRSPNYVYQPAGANKTRLLLKNYKLSDDMAFRFSNRGWKEWPLTMDKYVKWLDAEQDSPLVNLFVDFETFGEHQWADTGIFEFLKALPHEWLSRPDHTFMTVSEAAESFESQGPIDMPHTTTWADTERDLSAWLGNRMQQESQHYIYGLESAVMETGDLQLISDWRRLTTSDHPYYMSTKYWNDGDVHAYFSPYSSPYDAFLYYMNALRDVQYRVLQSQQQRKVPVA